MADDPIAGEPPPCEPATICETCDRYDDKPPPWFLCGECVNEMHARYDAAIRERDLEIGRLRVMAGLLEQCILYELPNGKRVLGCVRGPDDEQYWDVTGSDTEYPTARAAIEAGMGWTEEKRS